MQHIYLDQNKWIDLDKAARGRSDGTPFQEILAEIRGVVGGGRVRLPLSASHVIEVAKAPRPDQRESLAELMIEFSAGAVIRPATAMLPNELAVALRKVFGAPPAPRISPFGRGIDEAFGESLSESLEISPERARALKCAIDTPQGWRHFLCSDDDLRRAGLASYTQAGQAAIDLWEGLRAKCGKDKDLLWRSHAALITEYHGTLIAEELEMIGKGKDDFMGLGLEGLRAFWASIPSAHVELALHWQRNIQKSRPVDPNDSTDIRFLSVAIPYCDVVVTEKLWVDLAKREGLHTTYNTVLLSSLWSLSPHLGRNR